MGPHTRTFLYSCCMCPPNKRHFENVFFEFVKILHGPWAPKHVLTFPAHMFPNLSFQAEKKQEGFIPSSLPAV